MKVNIKKDSVYRDFYVVDVRYIPDYDLDAVFLRHKTTGLEVFHLVTDDQENLFSFLFRTPAFDSKGTPHIIEHSVLCGSEKYHLKEPFNNLCNSSVKTFANACTWDDFTGYPASSIVEKDFFNMMDIYADAVYFPLLEERTFHQEGHRFEIEDDGSLSIQGVVYNEMKANFTNFYRVYSEAICKAVHPYPSMKYNSGGDPLEVMKLEYEDFVNFHKTYYRPSNSLVFFYGNIPTEKNLDFLADNYIPRMIEKYGKVNLTDDQLKQMGSLVPESIKSYYTQKHPFVRGNFRDQGLTTGVNGNVVSVNWSVGKEGMDQYFLSEYLFGEESSPLAKVLKESEIGEDLAPMMGGHNSFEDGVFSIGLKGVKKEDEQKVYDKIFEILKDLVSKPVSQEDVDSTVNKIDFNLRQEYRNYGAPYSFVIMEKCATAWKHGMNPADRLTPITSFEEVKAKLREDPEYTNKLIRSYLLDNPEYATFVLEPAESFVSEREKAEKDFIAQAEKSIDKAELEKLNDELHAYQERTETQEELSVIPRLEIKDLTAKRSLGVTDIAKIKNHNGEDILLFKNIENTKGIVYFDVAFPVEKMDLEYYPYLSNLTEILLDLGWNGKTWDQADREDLQDIPNLYAGIYGGTVNNSDSAQKFWEQNANLNFVGRTWLRVSMNILAEKMDVAFEKLAMILKTIDFKDTEHFSTVLKANISNRKQNFVNSSLDYAFKRLNYKKSQNAVLQEILWGFTGYENAVNMNTEKCGEYLKCFEKMYTQIKEGGAIVHYTTDKKTAEKLDAVVQKFVKDAELLPLTAEKPRTKEELMAYVCQTSEEKNEYVNIDSQVGYATMTFPCSKYVTREFMAEDLFTTWFSGHALWDKIRTVNGAYGASMWLDAGIGQTDFYTYRDPRPDNSVKTVLEALEEVKNNGITEEDVNDTILSIFGQMTTPMVARDKGNNSFARTLFAQTNDQMEETISILKTLTVEDVMAALDRIIERIKERNEMIVLQNNVKGSGNLLRVSL